MNKGLLVPTRVLCSGDVKNVSRIKGGVLMIDLLKILKGGSYTMQRIFALAATRSVVGWVSMLAPALLLLAYSQPAGAHAGNNSTTVVHPCIGKIGGVVRIVAVNQECTSLETAIHWPNTASGTARPQGPQGPQGPARASANGVMRNG